MPVVQLSFVHASKNKLYAHVCLLYTVYLLALVTYVKKKTSLHRNSESAFLWPALIFAHEFNFCDLPLVTSTSQGAGDLSDQLHVVEQRVEAANVGEAKLMRCAASRNLGEEDEGNQTGNKVKYT